MHTGVGKKNQVKISASLQVEIFKQNCTFILNRRVNTKVMVKYAHGQLSMINMEKLFKKDIDDKLNIHY